MTRPLFFHIGASKTGTSSLQRGLFRSGGALAEQGIGMPLTGRAEHVEKVLRPMGWVMASGFVKPPEPAGLEAAADAVRQAAGQRLLLSCEDICEADRDRVRLLVDTLERAGADVHIILTVRSLAAVIPSEWQQFLKRRLTLDYPSFLAQLRDRNGVWAEHFWRRQDVEDICRRWQDRVDRDRIHVIVTPDRGSDPDGLYRLMGETVGFDPEHVSWPGRDVNAAWGYVEAEVYRRVNLALGDRLPDYERDYHPSVRQPFARGALPRGRSARIPLPPEHLDWVRATARAHVDHLRASGVHVAGDLDRLVPGPEAASPLPDVDEAEVARAAVETLANQAVYAWRQTQGRGA